MRQLQITYYICSFLSQRKKDKKSQKKNWRNNKQNFSKIYENQSTDSKISVNLKHKKHESKALHKISSKHKLWRDKFNKIYVKFIYDIYIISIQCIYNFFTTYICGKEFTILSLRWWVYEDLWYYSSHFSLFLICGIILPIFFVFETVH